MSADIKRLKTNPRRQKEQIVKEEIEQLEMLAITRPQLKDHISAMIYQIQKDDNINDYNRWAFAMIGTTEYRLVGQWLGKNSKRSGEAKSLWISLIDYLDINTGQIRRSRQELAKELEITPSDISRIMSELESIGAIIKKKEGRGIIYYMNPLIGTHLPKIKRDLAQSQAPKLKLVNGGKNEQDKT